MPSRKSKKKKSMKLKQSLSDAHPITTSLDDDPSSNKLRRVEVNGYVAISHPWQSGLPPGWLYLRRQVTDSDPDGKLFMANLPWPTSIAFKRSSASFTPTTGQLDAIKRQIKSIVPNASEVLDVFPIGDNAPRLAARLELPDSAAIDSVLQNPDDYVYLSARDKLYDVCEDEGAHIEDVVTKWVKQHEKERDVAQVEKWSEATMAAFEEREKVQREEKEKRKKLSSVPDEDGFITVVTGAPQMKAAELAASKGILDKGKGGKGKKGGKALLLENGKGIEKSGFYRWQRKNENMLGELRNKFREDQKRVNAIRDLDEMEQ